MQRLSRSFTQTLSTEESLSDDVVDIIVSILVPKQLPFLQLLAWPVAIAILVFQPFAIMSQTPGLSTWAYSDWVLAFGFLAFAMQANGYADKSTHIKRVLLKRVLGFGKKFVSNLASEPVSTRDTFGTIHEIIRLEELKGTVRSDAARDLIDASISKILNPKEQSITGIVSLGKDNLYADLLLVRGYFFQVGLSLFRLPFTLIMAALHILFDRITHAFGWNSDRASRLYVAGVANRAYDYVVDKEEGLHRDVMFWMFFTHRILLDVIFTPKVVLKDLRTFVVNHPGFQLSKRRMNGFRLHLVDTLHIFYNDNRDLQIAAVVTFAATAFSMFTGALLPAAAIVGIFSCYARQRQSSVTTSERLLSLAFLLTAITATGVVVHRSLKPKQEGRVSRWFKDFFSASRDRDVVVDPVTVDDDHTKSPADPETVVEVPSDPLTLFIEESDLDNETMTEILEAADHFDSPTLLGSVVPDSYIDALHDDQFSTDFEPPSSFLRLKATAIKDAIRGIKVNIARRIRRHLGREEGTNKKGKNKSGRGAIKTHLSAINTNRANKERKFWETMYSKVSHSDGPMFSDLAAPVDFVAKMGKHVSRLARTFDENRDMTTYVSAGNPTVSFTSDFANQLSSAQNRDNLFRFIHGRRSKQTDVSHAYHVEFDDYIENGALATLFRTSINDYIAGKKDAFSTLFSDVTARQMGIKILEEDGNYLFLEPHSSRVMASIPIGTVFVEDDTSHSDSDSEEESYLKLTAGVALLTVVAATIADCLTYSLTKQGNWKPVRGAGLGHGVESPVGDVEPILVPPPVTYESSSSFESPKTSQPFDHPHVVPSDFPPALTIIGDAKYGNHDAQVIDWKNEHGSFRSFNYTGPGSINFIRGFSLAKVVSTVCGAPFEIVVPSDRLWGAIQALSLDTATIFGYQPDLAEEDRTAGRPKKQKPAWKKFEAYVHELQTTGKMPTAPKCAAKTLEEAKHTHLPVQAPRPHLAWLVKEDGTKVSTCFKVGSKYVGNRHAFKAGPIFIRYEKSLLPMWGVSADGNVTSDPDKFAPVSDAHYLTSDLVLLSPMRDGKMVQTSGKGYSLKSIKAPTGSDFYMSSFSNPGSFVGTVCNGYISYSHNTADGDCGSPVYCLQDGAWVLCGAHHWATSVDNRADILSYSKLNDLITKNSQVGGSAPPASRV